MPHIILYGTHIWHMVLLMIEGFVQWVHLHAQVQDCAYTTGNQSTLFCTILALFLLCGVLPVHASTCTLTHTHTFRFKILLEHGVFDWTVYKYYTEILSLRRDLAPLRMRIRLGRRG